MNEGQPVMHPMLNNYLSLHKNVACFLCYQLLESPVKSAGG